MQETNFKKEVLVDFLQMTALFLASVIAVYKLNHTLRDIFFFIPLILAFRSKKDYFWFAYFFILINSPASFFVNRSMMATFRLPFYSIIPQFSLTPMDIFLFISIFKAFKANVKVRFYLNKPLEFFLFYLIVISIPVSFLLGTELKPFVNTLRSFFFYGIIFSFLRLIIDRNEVIKFGYLIVPYTILIIFSQLYVINMGNHFISLFDPSMLGFYVRNSISGEIRAVTPGILLIFYTLIFGFQINNNKKAELFPGFSALLMFLPIASFILSATRSWMTIGFITILGYILVTPTGLKFAVKFGVISFLLILALLSSNFIKVEFIENIYERYAVIGNLASSRSLSQADTFADRIVTDIPKVMKGIAYSPILGVGMSKYMKTYYSNDVGFINTILIYGIIGFPIFLYFMFRYIFLLNSLRKNKHYSKADKGIFISIMLALIGMLTGYFFTWDFFSFYPEKVFFVSIIFATGDLVLESSSRFEEVI